MKSEAPDRVGLVSALVTALCWSMAGVFVRGCGDFNPVLLTSARLGITLLLTVFLFPFIRRRMIGLFRTMCSPKAWAHSALLALYYVTAVSSFRFAPVGEIGLVISTSPVLVLLGQFCVSGRIRKQEGWGVAIAFLGVAVVLLTRPPTTMRTWPHETWGILLALGSAGFSALFSSLGRKLKKEGTVFSSLHLSVQTYLFGVLFFSFPLIWVGELSVPPSVIGSLMGLAVISTLVPSLTAAVAAQRLRPSVSTSFSLLLPILSTLAAKVFLHESVHAGFWPGAVMTLIGLLLLLRR